jgi:hypothetical protein
MSYHGRRGPNVSEYIANLNAVPSAQDLQNSNADNFNLDDDLAMFTNTQFFDFDLGQDADLQPDLQPNYGVEGREVAPSLPAEEVDLKHLDFSLQGKPCMFLCYGQSPIRVACVARLSTELSRGQLVLHDYMSVRPRCSVDMRWIPIKCCQSTGAIQHYTCRLGRGSVAS